MKPRTVACLSLPIFAASAWLAWSTAAGPHQVAGQVATRLSEPSSQSEQVAYQQKMLSQLARELVAGPKPAGTAFSAREMDSIFSREGKSGAFRYGWDWAEHDPEAMCAWIERRGAIRTEPGYDQSSIFASMLFRRWASRDADAALAAALLLSRAPARAQALVSALQVIWRTDPEKARQVLADNSMWLEAPAEVSLHYDDPVDLKFLASLPAGKIRGQLLSEVLADAVNSTSRSAHAEATALWQNLTLEQKQELAAAGFMQRHDALSIYRPDEKNKPLAPFPDEAELLRSYAESSGNIKAASDYLERYGDEWAATNPAEAVTWVLTHLKGGEQVNSVVNLFKAAAQENFDGAVAAWQLLPPGAMRYRAAGTILAASPQDRKAHAQSLVESLSAYERDIAEREASAR